MGNDVTAWRMSIGTFNNRSNLTLKCVVFKHSSLLTVLCLLLCGMKFQASCYSNALFSLVCDTIFNLEFSSVMVLLVLMSGDVAENPIRVKTQLKCKTVFPLLI